MKIQGDQIVISRILNGHGDIDPNIFFQVEELEEIT